MGFVHAQQISIMTYIKKKQQISIMTYTKKNNSVHVYMNTCFVTLSFFYNISQFYMNKKRYVNFIRILVSHMK